MNLGREYMHEWHDLMIEVEGPLVASLETQFEREWAHAGPWGDLGYAAAVFSGSQGTNQTRASQPWSKVRRLPTSKGLRKPFMTAVRTSFDQARNCIYIENGYLFDHGVVAALIRARKRGVDVRVILPRVNNFTVGIRSNMAIAERLRRNGVRVYLWPGMTHAKAVLVDGWACLGSANLNQWSFRLSQEENIATSDPAFAAHLKEKVFEPDFARSYELDRHIPLNGTDHVVDKFLSY
jgi:cardiolipin synthase